MAAEGFIPSAADFLYATLHMIYTISVKNIPLIGFFPVCSFETFQNACCLLPWNLLIHSSLKRIVTIPIWLGKAWQRTCLALFMFLCPLLVNAQIEVTDTTDTDLESAIISGMFSGQSVLLEFSDTVTLTNTLEITSDLVIDATGYDAAISGDDVTRVFHVAPECTLTLINVTINNGYSTSGGAIFNEGTLIVSNCTFYSNVATNAAGADGISYGDDDGEDGKNGTTTKGAAICSTGDLYVYDSSFLTNTVYGGNGGDGGDGGDDVIVGFKGGKGGNAGKGCGGAIYISGTGEIWRSTFQGNNSAGGIGGTPGTGGAGACQGDGGDSGLGGTGMGAGIYNEGTLKIYQCLFAENTSYGGNSSGVAAYGDPSDRYAGNGAAAVGGGVLNLGTLYVENSTFYTNVCVGGTGGSVSDTNSDVYSGSGGSGYGGALANMSGNSEIVNCTFATNNIYGGTNGTASDTDSKNGTVGKALGGNLYRKTGTIKIRNSILANGSSGANASGGVKDAGYNISSDASCKFTATGSKNSTSPELASDLETQDGYPSALPILITSPAVDAIEDSETAPEVDQRDEYRPQGAYADIGAYELDESDLVPDISVQPTNAIVLQDKNTTLSVTAVGGKPLSYQWSVDGIDISDATNATYTIRYADDLDSGDYTVTVSNPYGSIVSTNATISVILPVSIVTQPESTTVSVGDSVTLSVGVEGSDPISYQWFFNNKSLVDMTNADLTIDSTEATDTGSYKVVVSNPLGKVTSSKVTLKVLDPPSITTQPQDNTIVFGHSISMSVAATGTTPLTYQWYCDGDPIKKGTGAKLTISKASFTNSGTYTVTVSNAVGYADSDMAILTVIPPAPIITTSARKEYTKSTLVINGTLSTAAQISQITCTVNGIDYQTTIKGSKWFATVELEPGTNVVSAVASADYGESDPTTVNYFYSVKSTLQIVTLGTGTVSPNLNGQKLKIGQQYTMTATPGSKMIFKDWEQNGEVLSTSQTLSFVMSENLILNLNFIDDPYAPRKGNYIGLFQGEDSLQLEDSGMLTLALKERGYFTATLRQAAVTNRFSGQFDATGVTTVNRGDLLPLTLYVDLSTADTNWLSGVVSNSEWSSPFTGARKVYTSVTPSPGAGKYTLLLAHSDNTVGSSVASVTVLKAGAITATGYLADSTTLSIAGTACVDGYWPIYSVQNSGTGLLAGWLQLTNTDDNGAMLGTLTWISPGVSTYYPSGFTRTLTASASAYSASSSPVLSFTKGFVYFFGGNLDSSLSDSVVQSSTDVFTSTGTTVNMTLNVKSTTGLVSGTFIHPVTGASALIYGVVLQDQEIIQGFFMGVDSSGLILVSP